MGSVAPVEVNGYKIEPGAKLTRADLTRAKLRRAKLRYADLTHADLRGADLLLAYRRGVIGYNP